MSALEFSKPFGATLLFVLGFSEVPREAKAAGDYWLRRVDVEPAVGYLIDLAHRAARPVVHVLPPGSAIEPAGGGDRVVREGLSAFDGTGLDRLVARDDLRRVLIVGDGDVRTMSATIEDAREIGLTVAVVPDALLSAGPDEARALTRSLRRQGIAALRARDARFVPMPLPLSDPAPEPASAGEISWVTRAAVLAAFADEVSRAGGYASAHVARVARDSRLSLRTFYDAYPGGKVDCFVALYRDRAEALERAIRSAVRGFPDRHARAHLAVVMAVRAIVSDQPLARALLYEFPVLPEGVELHEATLDRFAALLGDLLPPDGRAPLSPLAVRGVIGGLIALALSPRVDDEDIDDLVDAVTLLLDGVLQQAAAR